MALLEVQALTKQYGKLEVLQGINFTLEKG